MVVQEQIVMEQIDTMMQQIIVAQMIMHQKIYKMGKTQMGKETVPQSYGLSEIGDDSFPVAILRNRPQHENYV